VPFLGPQCGPVESPAVEPQAISLKREILVLDLVLDNKIYMHNIGNEMHAKHVCNFCITCRTLKIMLCNFMQNCAGAKTCTKRQVKYQAPDKAQWVGWVDSISLHKLIRDLS
jgi:hypothetical protein